VVERPFEKQLLGRPSRRWENSIKMNHREAVCEDKRLMELVQGHVQWHALVSVMLKL